ncbi:MAG: leucine-rich repeat protein [Treponema sp.]|nr:leucine-rich repeat protein [Treponema sp.]
MKKLLLAGLVLLASVMVLVGCDTNAGGSAEIINSEIGQVLTFSADSEQTLTVNVYGNYTLHDSLQYSVGGGDWTSLEAKTPISFGGAAGDLRMRGKSLEGMAKGSAEYAYIVFGDDDVKVSCSGDIRTLVNYESPTTIDTSEARFSNLFKNCSVLTKAPALPAEKLADSCYERMFSGCTSLTSAPTLPAETLVPYCYKSMFHGCTNLTSAPELAAETLADYCYGYMFSGCTSLTSAPALAAETLVPFCYYGMFQGCTNLTNAPALAAETLADSCYAYMFYGCESLTSVTMLATDILAEWCLEGWLENVSKTGTFTRAAKMDETTLRTYIPSGWEVHDYVPQQ